MIGCVFVGGHSTTTWTKFYPIVTTLVWTNLDILRMHTTFLFMRPCVDFLLTTYPPTYLFLVHVDIEWACGERGPPTHIKLRTLIVRHNQKCLFSFFVLNLNQEGGILIVKSDLAFFLFNEVYKCQACRVFA